MHVEAIEIESKHFSLQDMGEVNVWYHLERRNRFTCQKSDEEEAGVIMYTDGS